MALQQPHSHDGNLMYPDSFTRTHWRPWAYELEVSSSFSVHVVCFLAKFDDYFHIYVYRLSACFQWDLKDNWDPRILSSQSSLEVQKFLNYSFEHEVTTLLFVHWAIFIVFFPTMATNIYYTKMAYSLVMDSRYVSQILS